MINMVMLREIKDKVKAGQYEYSKHGKVTYTLELEGKLYVIENVPARVCRETGEQLFSPGTVGCLQRTIWEKKKPKRVIETPVYEYGQLADPR
jgi:YgiT-type zinc finger domain-containing protein